MAQHVSEDEGAVGVAAAGFRRSGTDSAAPGAADRYRTFARVAAAAFFLVAVYTLAVKVPTGEFDQDWLHTVLHLVSGAVAVYVGWMASGTEAPGRSRSGSRSSTGRSGSAAGSSTDS